MHGFSWARMRWLMRRLPEMRFRVERAQAAGTRVTAQMTGMPMGGGAGNPTARAVELLEAVRGEYDRMRRELEEMRAFAAPLIAALENDNQRRVMEMRYLEGKTVRAIAWRLPYSERQIFRLLKDGESNAEKKKEEMEA